MSVQEQREEAQRILHAAQFRRAPKLRRFLEVICNYHFQNRSGEINEYLIAAEAFGKGPEFDPSHDSLVRVQAREVRRRLHEYYQAEGRPGPWALDIPVGHYAPVFTAVKAAAQAENTPSPLRPPAMRAAWAILAGTVLICAVLLGAADHERRLLVRSTARAAGVEHASLGLALGGLWNRFIESDVPTLLVVSNPEVDECADHKARPASCSGEEYTGMGEAVAIHLITLLFRSTTQTLIVKPSRIVTADDVKRCNLVLLGGKSVNIWTRRLGDGLSLRDANTPPQYETVMDSRTGAVTRDRAIVALRRHPATGHWLLFLWGQHSQGTHAAAEASTDPRFLAQLQWPGAGFPESFHVLLSVDVNDGVPERSLAVAVRTP
jgi:hypothetical protein